MTGYTNHLGGMDRSMTDVTLVDATGKHCPMPLLMAKRALAELADGDALMVLATDPAAESDLETFCRRHGHSVVCERTETHWRIRIGKRSRSGGAT